MEDIYDLKNILSITNKSNLLEKKIDGRDRTNFEKEIEEIEKQFDSFFNWIIGPQPFFKYKNEELIYITFIFVFIEHIKKSSNLFHSFDFLSKYHYYFYIIHQCGEINKIRMMNSIEEILDSRILEKYQKDKYDLNIDFFDLDIIKNFIRTENLSFIASILTSKVNFKKPNETSILSQTNRIFKTKTEKIDSYNNDYKKISDSESIFQEKINNLVTRNSLNQNYFQTKKLSKLFEFRKNVIYDKAKHLLHESQNSKNEPSEIFADTNKQGKSNYIEKPAILNFDLNSSAKINFTKPVIKFDFKKLIVPYLNNKTFIYSLNKKEAHIKSNKNVFNKTFFNEDFMYSKTSFNFRSSNETVLIEDSSPCMIAKFAEPYPLIYLGNTEGEIKIASYLSHDNNNNKNNKMISSDLFNTNENESNSFEAETKNQSLRKGIFIKDFKGHKGCITDLKIHQTCSLFVSASSDCTARAWNVEKLNCIRMFPHTGCVNSINLSDNYNVLVTGGEDSFVRTWDLREGNVLDMTIKNDNEVDFVGLDLDLKLIFYIDNVGDFNCVDMRKPREKITNYSSDFEEKIIGTRARNRYDCFDILDRSIYGLYHYKEKKKIAPSKSWVGMGNKDGKICIIDYKNFSIGKDYIVTDGYEMRSIYGMNFGIEGILGIVSLDRNE